MVGNVRKPTESAGLFTMAEDMRFTIKICYHKYMKIFNKLIRDNIPSIIEKDDKTCVITVLDDDQFLIELKGKLVEESKEVVAANTRDELINEIADIQEIVDKLKDIYTINQEEIEIVQLKKALKNGKFDKKLFLVSVDEKHE